MAKDQPTLNPCTVKVLLEALESGDCCSKALASRLGMTPAAVDQHFCRAMHRLQADSRGGALLKAVIGGHMPGYRLTCRSSCAALKDAVQASQDESNIQHVIDSTLTRRPSQ